MPRTYAHNHAPRRRGADSARGAVAISQRQAANPYRMHTGDPLVSGVSNLAAALFRAPQERAQIEDQRAAHAAEIKHRDDRETKDDLFREKQLAMQQEDAQARAASRAAGAKPAGQTGAPKMGTIPAFVKESRIDPLTNKPVYTQRPLNDDEMAAALKNQQRTQAVGALAGGTNPANGKPLGAANPYVIEKPQAMAEQDALFVPAGAKAPAPVQAAAKPALGLPAAQPPVGGMPAHDPHAVVDPNQFPPGLLDALYPGGPQQAQAASQKVAALHPADQQQYGQLLSAVVQAHQAGDAQAIAATSAKLQVANQRLGVAAPAAQPGLGMQPAPAPVGGMPQAAAAPRPALAMAPNPADEYVGGP